MQTQARPSVPKETVYCDFCHLSFGTHEPKKQDGEKTYHQSCYGKVLLKKFKSIGSVAIH